MAERVNTIVTHTAELIMEIALHVMETTRIRIVSTEGHSDVPYLTIKQVSCGLRFLVDVRYQSL
jgi:hypothetical protein